MNIDMLTAIVTLQLTGVVLFELFSRRQAATAARKPLKLVVVPWRVDSVEDVREAA